jgi:hypothetical protein
MQEGVETKQCSRCKKTKYAEYFSRRRDAGRGLRSWCKLCMREHVASYKTPEKQAYWRAKSRQIGPRYSATKRSAKARHHDFLLTIKEYEGLIKDAVCHYCAGALPETRGGLDRKDTNGPYSTENCVPCCVECNRIKGCALSYSEMLEVAKLLKEMRK